MKILAIIPVCEGSQSLPNKNLRVINGKPMVYYALNNALKSRYITDTIVTTNSDEVITIARQMGAMVKKRRSELSSTSVSLDEVVFDVKDTVDFSQYDYIVTMQPISPILKHTTLDKAIERCISEQADTMISVVDRAQYYWSKNQNGECVPLTHTRMNKHQLPPFYMETGAFFITKPQCIKVDTRIGEKCSLYELESDEALDVFTFGDLKQAENILSRKKIAFYVNGNNIRGLGHIYRVLQLADEFFTKPAIYFDSALTKVEYFGETNYNTIPVDGVGGLVDALRENGCDILINDILSTEADYMIRLKEAMPAMKTVNFEDEGSGAEYADIVFNALYDESTADNVRAGADYYIVPKLFLLCDPISINDRVKNVLVTFGGADPMNYTDIVLSLAKKEKYRDIHFTFVIGRAKKNFESLLKCACGNIKVLYDITNMPDVMSRCDIALSSRGRTGYELAVLGIPAVSIAQNDREERHNFMSDKNGYLYIGYDPGEAVIEQTLDKLAFSDKETRAEMQRKLLSHDLRSGRKHIMNIIDNL